MWNMSRNLQEHLIFTVWENRFNWWGFLFLFLSPDWWEIHGVFCVQSSEVQINPASVGACSHVLAMKLKSLEAVHTITSTICWKHLWIFFKCGKAFLSLKNVVENSPVNTIYLPFWMYWTVRCNLEKWTMFCDFGDKPVSEWSLYSFFGNILQHQD